MAPVSLTSDSADVGGSGVDTVVFERSPAGANTWTATAASWNTASGPDSVADGNYDLRVKTTDKAGNSFTSPLVTVLVDHTAPVTSASLAPGSPSNAPVTVSFTAGDGSGSGVSTTSYRVDGGRVLQGSSVIVCAPGDHSNDGNHVVEFFSTDDVGNVETPKTVNVLIDTTAPNGTPGDPGDYLRGIANLTYSTSATDVSSVQFQFSPASAGRLVEYRRRRRRAALRGLLDDHPRRRRPVRPARRRHRLDRQRRQRAPPGPAEDRRQHGSLRLRHVARAVELRLRQRRRDRDRNRRRRAARLGRLRGALRDQALRRRLVHRLRHADRPDRRLDLPAVRWPPARSPTARPTCRSSSPTSPATRQRPRPGRSTSTTTHRPSRSTTPAPPSARAST